jgi:hypothetical protein
VTEKLADARAAGFSLGDGGIAAHPKLKMQTAKPTFSAAALNGCATRQTRRAAVGQLPVTQLIS